MCWPCLTLKLFTKESKCNEHNYPFPLPLSCNWWSVLSSQVKEIHKLFCVKRDMFVRDMFVRDINLRFWTLHKIIGNELQMPVVSPLTLFRSLGSIHGVYASFIHKAVFVNCIKQIIPLTVGCLRTFLSDILLMKLSHKRPRTLREKTV